MRDADIRAFRNYLSKVENKADRTVTDYAKVVAHYDYGKGQLPICIGDMEKLQYVWLAFRRFRAHGGEAPESLAWIPMKAWLTSRQKRVGQYRQELESDEKRLAFIIEGTADGVQARCVGCDEVSSVRGEDSYMECGRAAAVLAVREHRDRSWLCGAWCEELEVELDSDHDFHILWLHPPIFRTWPEEERVRGGGVLARGAADAMADLEEALVMAEGDDSLWPAFGGGDCSCGYMAVGGPGGGIDCPVCGPTGLG